MYQYDFGDGAGLVRARPHSNGGGMVASTANVADSVYLDRGCVVFGHAQIKGNVRIVDRCRVSGVLLPGGVSTLIEDQVLLSGRVVVEGYVLMRDNAQARGSVKLSAGVAVMHNARVIDRARLAGQVHVRDHAYIHEDVTIIAEDEGEIVELCGRDVVGGSAILRTIAHVNAYLAKPVKRRRVRKSDAEMVAPIERSRVMSLRPATVMPSLADVQSIRSSRAEPRFAAA